VRLLELLLLEDFSHLSAFNQFPVTLEEQMVNKMAPLVETSGPNHLHYQPASGHTHNAMSVTHTTSVIYNKNIIIHLLSYF
jgi:hypothetical protein